MDERVLVISHWPFSPLASASRAAAATRLSGSPARSACDVSGRVQASSSFSSFWLKAV